MIEFGVEVHCEVWRIECRDACQTLALFLVIGDLPRCCPLLPLNFELAEIQRVPQKRLSGRLSCCFLLLLFRA